MVECVVPFAGCCEHRERALEFILDRAEYPVTISATVGPWSKARAVRPAVEASSANIVVVADADCVTDGLFAAIQAVKDWAAWAIPHGKVCRLTKAGTELFMSTGEYAHPFDRRPYRGFPGGGFVVAPRETLLNVPLDPRFVGWGQEDEAWAVALTCLVGPPWRGNADLVHLYHPPEPRVSRRKGSEASWGLYRRYRNAATDPHRMRELLKEVT